MDRQIFEDKRIWAVGLVVIVLLVAGGSLLMSEENPSSEPELETEPHPDSEVTAETVSEHETALTEAGSFTATQDIEMASNGEVDETQSGEISYLFDTENGTAYNTQENQAMTVNRYTDGNTTYMQLGSGNETQYDMASEPYDDQTSMVQPIQQSSAMGGSLVQLAGQKYVESGTDEVDGVPVTVYTSDEQAAIDSIQAGLNQDTNTEGVEVTDFSVEVMIDDAGVIRQQAIDLEIQNGDQTRSQTITHTITDVGETTVDEPDWLDDAKEATSDDGSDDTGSNDGSETDGTDNSTDDGSDTDSDDSNSSSE